MRIVQGMYIDDRCGGWMPLGSLTHEIRTDTPPNPHSTLKIEVVSESEVPRGTFHDIWWSLSLFRRPPLRP